MYDKVNSEDGSFESYMGSYRAQNTITVNARMTDFADPEYYPTQHRVTVQGPQVSNVEAATRLAGQDGKAIREHVKQAFVTGKDTLKEWVQSAMRAQISNPGLTGQALYDAADAGMESYEQAARVQYSQHAFSNNERIDRINQYDLATINDDIYNQLEDHIGDVDENAAIFAICKRRVREILDT